MDPINRSKPSYMKGQNIIQKCFSWGDVFHFAEVLGFNINSGPHGSQKLISRCNLGFAALICRHAVSHKL